MASLQGRDAPVAHRASVGAQNARSLPEGPRLHLGCGLTAPEDWVNLDGSWNAWLARHRVVRKALVLARILPAASASVAWSQRVGHHDARRPLPFAPGSVSAVYASHLLEHLYRTEAEALIRECHRVLAPGGVLRLVVPDLRAIVEGYLGRGPLASTDGGEPADLVNERLLLREREPPGGPLLLRWYRAHSDLHSHKWMYDASSVAALLRRAGFVEVAERPFLDSRIPGIQAVESESRVLHGAGVCVEGVRR